MTTEKDTIETWNTYGTHQLTRGLELPELDRWDWGCPADHGQVVRVWP